MGNTRVSTVIDAPPVADDPKAPRTERGRRTLRKLEEQAAQEGAGVESGAEVEGADVEAATVLLTKPHYSVLSVPLPGHPGCAAVAAPASRRV